MRSLIDVSYDGIIDIVLRLFFRENCSLDVKFIFIFCTKLYQPKLLTNLK